jgi:hypothetical protein
MCVIWCCHWPMVENYDTKNKDLWTAFTNGFTRRRTGIIYCFWRLATDVREQLSETTEFINVSFLVWPLLRTHCWYKDLFLHVITLRHTTLGRTTLDEWSARRRDLYLTTHNNHKRQTSTLLGGIRTRNPSKRAKADPRVRPSGHWDRHYYYY